MERIGLNRIFGTFVVALFSLAHGAFAQNSLRGTLITGLGDVATIKRDAEAGNVKAQVALGDSLSANFHSLEALTWYRKAADQSDSEGAYQTGHLLLFGGVGIPKEQTVRANPPEGIRWTFQAATNFHPYAMRDMSRAFQQGLGVSTNSIQAYAWQQLYAETRPGDIVGKVELNQLALKLDSAVIKQAQQLAAEFRQGHWSQPVVRVVSNDGSLTLNSIIFGKTPLAIISGKTFAEGESGKVTIRGQGSVVIKCLRIEKDSVTISVEGEDAPRHISVR
jgi:hypothetical protein